MRYQCKVCGGTADRLKICCGEKMTLVDERSSQEEDKKRAPQE